MAKKELEKNQEKMRRSSGMPRTPFPNFPRAFPQSSLFTLFAVLPGKHEEGEKDVDEREEDEDDNEDEDDDSDTDTESEMKVKTRSKNGLIKFLSSKDLFKY
jgi:hypothetical protein